MYTDLFVPPFEPWSASAAVGTRVSASGRLLVDDHDEAADQQRGSPGSGQAVEREKQHRDSSNVFGEMWGGAPRYSSAAERRRCHLDLTQNGMTRRGMPFVFWAEWAEPKSTGRYFLSWLGRATCGVLT